MKYNDKIKILERNIGEEIGISAGYVDFFGEVLKVLKETGRVIIKIDKKRVRHIDINKIYCIEEKTRK